MDPQNLVLISVTAFVAVFVLLTLLAVVMDLITRSFPQTATEAASPPKRPKQTASPPPQQAAPPTSDTARIAAIASAYSRIFPDKQVIRIEEISS